MRKTLLAVSLCAAGCAYNPDIELPTNNTAAVYNQALTQHGIQADDAETLGAWVTVLPDELQTLLAQLRENNLDLDIAKLRIERAQQLQRSTAANHWPSLSGALSNRDNYDEYGKTSDSNSLNFSASYTVDLWGARAAQDDQREIQLQVQRWQQRSLMISLQAQFIRTYVQTLALNELRNVAEQNYDASVKLLELFELTFEAGSASGIELRQQKNVVLNARSKLINLEQSVAVNERALALLLGDTDLTPAALKTTFSDFHAPNIAALQPAELLEQRPDIQIAQLALREDQSLLHQAEVSRWPDLSLSASWGLSGVLSGASDWAGSLGEAVSVLLLDGGQAKAQVRIAELDADINRANYLYTVADAYRDVLDQLQDYQTRVQQLEISEQTFDNSRALYDLSKIRYEAGDTDFINLLLAQQTWFSANELIVTAKRDYFITLVNVYESMGSAPALEAITSPSL
ncbi:TolC family protein [Gilvimarinus polysaccharolyticus]|uniref:TolC family protein n=1 Tax=Gilvimarinus polysaccharolyticus TaxID=863921 RepID=UPI000673800E|nr:TolC family protein [Gilvimarinus polysaccharolyticus]